MDQWHSVSVVIYDSSPTEFAAINSGIQSWNANTECSNVNFGNADSSGNPPSEIPPERRMWITRGTNTQVFPIQDVSNQMISAAVRVQTPFNSSTPNALRNLLRHEIGHTFGLLNAPLNNPTIMSGPYTEITACDREAVRKVYCPEPTPSPSPEPSPSPFPPPPPFECEPPYGVEGSYCPLGTTYDLDTGLCCPYGSGTRPCDTSLLNPQCSFNINEYCVCRETAGVWSNTTCRCWNESPILVDTSGDGIELTSATDGVYFDMRADGVPKKLAWTTADSDDAFLSFDRNQNGMIDNGRELFGNITPQPASPERNGFLALAEYDATTQGGNADGIISAQDAIFGYLRLWKDLNHDGVSYGGELFRLGDVGVKAIQLDYRTSERTDRYGNKFRYKAKVRDRRNSNVGRWAWDVFLKVDEDDESVSLIPRGVKIPLSKVSSCGTIRL